MTCSPTRSCSPTIFGSTSRRVTLSLPAGSFHSFGVGRAIPLPITSLGRGGALSLDVRRLPVGDPSIYLIETSDWYSEGVGDVQYRTSDLFQLVGFGQPTATASSSWGALKRPVPVTSEYPSSPRPRARRSRRPGGFAPLASAASISASASGQRCSRMSRFASSRWETPDRAGLAATARMSSARSAARASESACTARRAVPAPRCCTASGSRRDTQRGQRARAARVEHRGVVAEHEPPRRVRVQLVGEPAREPRVRRGQRPLEVPLAVRAPRTRADRGRAVPRARDQRARALVDVDEGQPVALRQKRHSR